MLELRCHLFFQCKKLIVYMWKLRLRTTVVVLCLVAAARRHGPMFLNVEAGVLLRHLRTIVTYSPSRSLVKTEQADVGAFLEPTGTCLVRHRKMFFEYNGKIGIMFHRVNVK